MSNEIASAYVSLIANMPGVKQDLERSLGGSDVQSATKKAGAGLGSKLVAGLGGVLKTGAIAVGATAVAGLGTAVVKGMGRLQSLDQATAKLDGLGHSAEGVDKIMSNALESVRGTAFGLDSAASTAASAVAAGIAPGADLENHLRLVADAATIAGTDMGSMGAIFGKVAASNKLQGDVIAQLHDAGVPALALVADQMGVTAEEASKMASKGEIDFATFSAAMEGGLGGAALKSGDTFAGAMANVGASLGRVGAGLLGGVFPQIAPLLGAITTALGPLEGIAGSLGEKLGQVLAPGIQWLTDVLNGGIDISGFVSLLTTFSPLANLFKILQPILPLLLDAFMQIGATLADVWGQVLPTLVPIVSTLVTMLSGLAAQIIPMLLPIITEVVGVFGQLAMTIYPMIGEILPMLSSLLALVVPIFMQLLGAILPLLDPIMQLITPLLGLVMTILPPLLDLFVMLIGFAIVPLQLAMSALIPLITGVVEAIATFLAPVIESLTGILTGLITFLTGVFTGDWEMVWQGIQDIFGGIWDTVKSIATGALNFIIDLVNGAIDGINGLADGISDLTGGAIDISIPHIPRLAEGGVVKARPGGIIANIGEGRYDEAVVPLSPGVLNALGGGGSQPVTQNNYITSTYVPDEIARETANALGWAVH